ncbi:MAG: hypothetical protein FJZ57_00515 [Chlamydiae bacterium]|nr:hypothetical protein [Chlamydiota bacterium]
MKIEENTIQVPTEAQLPTAQAKPTIEPTEVGRLPGIVSIIFFPFDLIYNIFKLSKAKALGDKEALLEARIRLSSLPLNVFGSSCSILTMLYQIGNFLKCYNIDYFTIPLSKAAEFAFNVSGLALSVVECIVEIIAIKRQVNFLKHIHIKNLPSIEKFFNETDPNIKKEILLKAVQNINLTPSLPLSSTLRKTLSNLEILLTSDNPPTQKMMKLAVEAMDQATTELLINDAEYINDKYLILTEKEKTKIESIVKKSFSGQSETFIAAKIEETEANWLHVKSNNLARRVAPWCAIEISHRLNPILQDLKSSNPEIKKQAIKDMKELLSTSEIQAKKFLILHSVSLVIFALSACVAIASLALFPPLVPLVGMTTILIASTVSYVAHEGMIKQKGWKFCAGDLIPDFLKIDCSKISRIFQAKAPQPATNAA